MNINRDTIRLLSFFLSFLLLTSCNEDEFGNNSDIPDTSDEITFEIGFAPQTRVSTGADFINAWENGDAIGLFAVRHNGSGGTLAASDNYIHNVKLTFNGTDWMPETPLYYPGADKLDFYAYYPYRATAINPTAIVFNVQPDQYASTDFKSSDFMLSTPLTDITKGETVNLSFNHKLALLQVKVSNQTGTAINNNFRVTLSAVTPQITANLSDGSITSSGTPAGITLYPFDATTYIYRAIVPAAASSQRTMEFRQESPTIYNIYTGTFALPTAGATELEITLKAN